MNVRGYGCKDGDAYLKDKAAAELGDGVDPEVVALRAGFGSYAQMQAFREHRAAVERELYS